MSLLVAAFFFFAAPSETYPREEFAFIDRHAVSAPRSAERSAAALAAYLTAPAKTERDKARSIYRWITQNIRYDTGAYFSGSFRNSASKPSSTLQTRSSVCDGYAGLFAELGTLAGLQVRKISGWAKGYGYKPGQTLETKTNHAWNAVRLGGQWVLLDTTWGAGFVDRKSKKFVRRFNEFHFLTHPAQFIYSRFPQDPKWQLLRKPVSKGVFEQLVFARPPLFTNQLGFTSHRFGTIRTGDNVTVELSRPRAVGISAVVAQQGVRLEKQLVFVEPLREKVRVHARFPRKGIFELMLFSKRLETIGPFEHSASYQIIASAGTTQRFPVFFPPFFRDGLRLESHQDGIINASKELTISIGTSPGIAISAVLKLGERKLGRNFVFVQRKEGGAHIKTLLPIGGEYTLSIFSKPANQTGVYNGALEFRVNARRGAGKERRFPESYPAYNKLKAKLLQPWSGFLHAKKSVLFEIDVPSVQKVAVVQGRNWQYLKRKGQRFRSNILLRKGKATVYSKRRGTTKWESLLTYHIN